MYVHGYCNVDIPDSFLTELESVVIDANRTRQPQVPQPDSDIIEPIFRRGLLPDDPQQMPEKNRLGSQWPFSLHFQIRTRAQPHQHTSTT